MTGEKTQREIIESEMVQLIGELRQLKRVGEALDKQTEIKTVGDYLLDGGVAGRIFIRRSNFSANTGPYRIVKFSEPEREDHIYRPGYATVQFIDDRKKQDIPPSYLLGDKEAPLEDHSA